MPTKYKMTGKNDKETELKDEILQEINRLGNGTKTLWIVFAMCISPAILNGLQMSSYIFLGKNPDNFYCLNSELLQAGWSHSNIRNISTRTVDNSCNVLNWNYTKLSQLKSHDEVMDYVNSVKWPNQVYCKNVEGNFFFFEDGSESIVAEWDLVCDREALRPTVQMALSFGKFIGAFLFGIIADKYGRKTSVTIGGLLYVIFGPMGAFATSYWLFVIVRFILGAAGSAVFHSAYTILTEFATLKYRSYLSILFNLPYPIGMMLMTLIAYYIHPWRYFQLTLSLPAILLIPHYFFFNESPRWLVKKGKINEAYKIVFGKKINEEEYKQIKMEEKEVCHENRKKNAAEFLRSIAEAIKDGLTELRSMYGNRIYRKRLLICHFCWFTTSLAYYVLALNGGNFHANQYIYTAITGVTEIPSYFLPMLMFRWLGRKSSSIVLFLISGGLLLSILAIPSDLNNLTVTVAIIARTCVSATFAILILHASEMFPTEIRNSVIGTNSTMAHIGSISAPYIADSLNVFGWYIPTTICGSTCLIAGFLMFLQPETKDFELDQPIDEAQ